jgi:hypothetical protein
MYRSVQHVMHQLYCFCNLILKWKSVVEQHLYQKIEILHGESAWECHAMLCEALGDHALTEWVQAFRSRRVSEVNVYLRLV